MKFKTLPFALIAFGSFILTSCSKNDDNPVTPVYDVPTKYNFTNVNYSEATQAVNMATGLQNYLSKATTRKLSQDSVNYLWNNTNNGFTSELISNLTYTPTQLNAATTVKLSSLASDPTIIKSFADSMVKISQLQTATAVQGVAGKLVSGTTTRIINYTGLEFNQLVVKGLMGALQMSQVFQHLDKSVSADNNTVTATGSAMQHEWDLAFGYVSLPIDYDTTVSYTTAPLRADRPLGIGGYFAERAKPIAAGGTVFSAFLKGRAAIGAKDYAVRDAAIATIKEYLEKTLAVSAYTYLNLSKTRAGNNVSKFHDYSEGYGFTLALKYRAANSKLTSANYQTLIDILKSDFWTFTDAKADQAIAIIKSTYGFTF